MEARNRRFGRSRAGSNRGWAGWLGAFTIALAAVESACAAGDSSGTSPKPEAAPEAKAKKDGAPGAADAKADNKSAKTTAAETSSAPQPVLKGARAAGRTKTTRLAMRPAALSSAKPTEPATPETPIARAIREIADCQARYQGVTDYTCTLFKQERIAGRLIPVHIMAMKVRTKPQSIYLKFQQPARGREAIYVAGRHGGRVLAHDVGFNKLLAGTLELEPRSARAMEDCRHPITEAGIGPLLETVSKRWSLELKPEDSIVQFNDDMQIGSTRCTMIESIHPERGAAFLHHKVRVFIDTELGLPIRFEAYDWPKRPGTEPELTEEYTYTGLKLNVGLEDSDFDTTNSAYSFGRF
jgi:Protein of unknown function (DUF1571)